MKNKIIGIGNAITDILIPIADSTIKDLDIVKGSMTLIDDNFINKIDKLNLKINNIISGGSVCNSIVALSQLGIPTEFIGSVANDKTGNNFLNDLKNNNTNFNGVTHFDLNSASSYIFITNDAQRTMCTYLGCASNFNNFNISNIDFTNVAMLYIEGYLWDSPSTINFLKEIIKKAKFNNVKISFSLSDVFCVNRHKNDFLELISNDIDILFANEIEANELLSTNNINELILKIYNLKKDLVFAITRSQDGCIIINNNNFTEIPALNSKKVIDTTGAGDIFASGFLNGYLKNMSLESCGFEANKLASKIIQKFGARFDKSEII